jgi:hypothetical protein
MQNIKQMQKAIIIIAFKEVAKIIALGTRLRGSLVSSTVDYISIGIEA